MMRGPDNRVPVSVADLTHEECHQAHDEEVACEEYVQLVRNIRYFGAVDALVPS